MGLGSLSLFGLAEARAKAAECRRQAYEGIDPIEARRAQRVQAALEAATALTFKDCTEQYLAAHGAGWRNAKHAAQWSSTLKTYAEPVIGALAVQSIDTALVMKIIESLWSKKPETASRLRGRIEAVLDWATVRGFRQAKIQRDGAGISTSCCRRAPRCAKSSTTLPCPITSCRTFMTALRAQDGVAARALEYLILTAARTGEVIGAQPEEIKDKVWTVPAGRMKS